MNKYEKLIEHIINENEDAARALFHEIVVEKSRDIYESLMDEELGGNQVDNLVDEISADEEGVSEDDEFGADEFGHDDEGADDEFGGEEDEGEFGHEEFGHEEGGEGETEQNIKNALAELEAEFNKLIGGEHEEEFGDEGEEELGGEEEFGDEGEENEFDAEEELGENKSDIELMREYVEKVADQGQKTEGGEVGKGGSATINKQGIVAGKNDMGGTTANILKGGAEQNPDGKQFSKPNNAYSKGAGEINSGNRNVPGGKAGSLESTGKSYEKAKGKEGQTTSGSLSVNTKSIEG